MIYCFAYSVFVSLFVCLFLLKVVRFVRLLTLSAKKKKKKILNSTPGLRDFNSLSLLPLLTELLWANYFIGLNLGVFISKME